MNNNEVEKQLRDDHEKFINQPYSKGVPDGLVEKFIEAVMIVPPQAHGINFNRIKGILDKKEEELTVADINDIIKVVINTPLQAFYDDVYEAVNYQLKMERFILKFNDYLKDFTETSNKKREMLKNLSDGVLSIGRNGIIPNGKHY